ncbi:FACT complex subunit spt16 [Taphrina deformans PYCC 5710]|uniref:FACT complex subunit n=1 Tax=Taphrina deformans (strain PYCC 5710 / ATCC 11124 / CBS 356.35 / IMI 108563 / JCM 9778 / NBRC 8474) TaxID=1097556 RepID=R4X8W5_TAPDE|nr:FACT complex subunit spt16 [Taphrina deformans PYCC 5710]|eukprot:CCG80577.1 FACT complex subunit spt16 [Taphrina deformans PYCC 5710]
MAEIKIDSAQFHGRLQKLLDYWSENAKVEGSVYNGLGSIVVLMGSADEDNPYQKTAALHTWLLGYEFPATLILITLEKLTFVTSTNKAKHLEPLVSGAPITIDIRTRAKDEAANQKLFMEIAEVVKAKPQVGVFAKDVYKGKIIEEWSNATQQASIDGQLDLGGALAPCMAIKDEQELKHMKTACAASRTVLTDFFVDRMSSIIDAEKTITHSALAEQTERVLENAKFLTKIKGGSDFDPDQLEWCYTPIIQSGGKYDLKPSAMSDDEVLHDGVIICSLGLRYKSYCSNIGRTYLIDPSEVQVKHYEFLVSLQKQAIEAARDGVVIKEFYNNLLDTVRRSHPELEAHFPKNLGSGIGIDFRDTSLILSAKNNRRMEAGMTLNLSIGFQDLENPTSKTMKGKRYSLLLVDTVTVRKESSLNLTDTPKSKSDISYYFNDEEEKPKVKSARSVDTSAILPKKTRGVGRPINESDEQKRREHQKELATKLQEEGLKRFPDGAKVGNGNAVAPLKKFESYRREAQMPQATKDLQIVVDQRNSSIVVPIYGRPVPFHINTIKNVSKNDEGDFVYLRINLLTPGQVIGKKDDMPFEDPNANFIRSLTFRSSDTDRMSDITKQIQEMKKNATKKELEKKELADVVEQDNLTEVKNRRPQKLLDIYVRPGLDGKRVTGELEIQQNGLRYQSPVRSDHRIDILFSNIRHLFFQPCDNELVVIIHVSLKSPIMIGKKKAKDVQFYREASDVQFDETANRKRKYKYGDEDELEAEQDERRRRAQLNKEFKSFSEKISEASEGRVEVDIPFRELGFTGVPFRSNCLLQPTTDCLVHLSDTPFLCVTLADIEIAHLERIQFGLKNFDMVLVFKDFAKAPVHINTIPMTSLDNVKEWLDSTDIPTSEGPLNLNWGTIMKTVNDDPVDFFREGGWAFLLAESDDDQTDASESASEYIGSDVDSASESDSSFDDDEDGASDDSGSAEVSDEDEDMSDIAEDDESD